MPLGLRSTSFSKYFIIQRAGKCLHLHVWGSGISCEWECYTAWIKNFSDLFTFEIVCGSHLIRGSCSSSRCVMTCYRCYRRRHPQLWRWTWIQDLWTWNATFLKQKCTHVVHNKSKFRDSKYHLIKNLLWLRPFYHTNFPVIPVIFILLGRHYKFEQSPSFCGHKSLNT